MLCEILSSFGSGKVGEKMYKPVLLSTSMKQFLSQGVGKIALSQTFVVDLRGGYYGAIYVKI